MNIKQASEQSGVSAPNIRFYEKEGLLTPARRQGNDYRDYTAGNVRTLKLIRMLRMLDANNVAWQIGEMGRLDLGGGGTIAKYVANRGIKVLDMGVPVLSMHSPFEVIHKTDLYMAYRAFVLFNQAAE